MNKTIKKILSLVIAVAMLTAIMTTTLSVSAEEKSAVTDKISSTAEYYLSLYKDEMPSYGSEWTVMSLARAVIICAVLSGDVAPQETYPPSSVCFSDITASAVSTAVFTFSFVL